VKPAQPLPNEGRIEILDGFRCIAVMAVIAYHYFYCFNWILDDPEYPSWYFFAYGYFGVHLFFMISGFVIYRSLEQSDNIREFLGKRYLRLTPTLILGSIITYVLVYWWNRSGPIEVFGPETPADFLFSFTFIHPDIWNSLLDRNDIGFVDGAYWSLWSEVVFYVFASALYFNSRKENFLRNWFIIVLVLNIFRVVTPPDFAYHRAFMFMNINQWIYFSVGILFYSLWMRRTIPTMVFLIASILFVVEIYFITSNGVRLIFPITIAMWIVFLRQPAWLRFLQWRPIQLVGLISYPLYVLHESAGLVLSEKFAAWTNHSIPNAFLLMLVLAVFILLAYFVFAFFEKPLTRTLKEKLLGIK
jgi:peptidoglycan/LPS O-acetylase OafA/YrhL